MSDLGYSSYKGGLATVALSLTLVASVGGLATAAAVSAPGNPPPALTARQGAFVQSTPAPPVTPAATAGRLGLIVGNGVVLSGDPHAVAGQLAEAAYGSPVTLSARRSLTALATAGTAPNIDPSAYGAYPGSIIAVGELEQALATLTHDRNILVALRGPWLLHTRTIVNPFILQNLPHSRTIFAALRPVLHQRTIIARLTLLNAGIPETGTTGAGSTTTVVVLDSTASATTGIYVGFYLMVGGETRLITAYDGPTRSATVSPALSSAPGSGVAYTISLGAGSTGAKVLKPVAEITGV